MSYFMTPEIKQTLDNIVNTSSKITEAKKSIGQLQKEARQLCSTLNLKKEGKVLHSFESKNYVLFFDEDGKIESILELQSLDELLEEPETDSE
jgi:phage host-nuclease inhibitor protein Gam